MPRRAVPIVLVSALLVAGCGGGGNDDDGGLGATGCEPDRQDRLDPGSAAHVLAGGAEPDYAVEPPTSGPHTPTGARSGLQPSPLSRPEQVGALEGGGILLQHDGLSEADREALESLAGPSVAVAANAELPAPIVATAWLRTMRCSTPDLAALERFVEAHLGQAPGSDG